VNGVLVQGFLWEDQLRIAAEIDGAGAVVVRGSAGRDHHGKPTGEVQRLSHDRRGTFQIAGTKPCN
jgi:hypothetical protein